MQALRGGVVDYVDASRIVVRVNDDETVAGEVGVDIYNLIKYTRSNQNTNINQRPIVKVGDLIATGDVIADGASTDMGELALGQNMLVAFMPWNGYNFEDSILISERVVADDRYTSIHIEELTVVARDTKLGPEEITPRHLEPVRGAARPAGRVGHRLHRRRSGGRRRAGRQGHAEGRDPAHAGREAAARDLRREGLRREGHLAARAVGHVRHRDRRAGLHPRGHRARQARPADHRGRAASATQGPATTSCASSRTTPSSRIERLLIGKIANGGPKKLAKGAKITKEYLHGLERYHWFDIRLPARKRASQLEQLKASLEDQRKEFDQAFEEEEEDHQGDELPPGVQKMVKVYLAVKRRLQPGDKMAGRHGNKGVVSKIVPVEDMPYMADGTPVDIVLNPLGVPSRMNVGPDPRDAPGLGREGPRPEDRRDARRSRSSRRMRKFLDEIYNKSGKKRTSRLLGRGDRRAGRQPAGRRAVRDAGVRRRDRGRRSRRCSSSPGLPRRAR